MQTLGAFIRERRDEIVARWLEQVCELPSAVGHPTVVLRDHVPQLLDQLAAELLPDESADALHELAGKHAINRYREGYDLRQVVLEHQVLRQTILAAYLRDLPPESTSAIRRLGELDRVLDEAIGDAVEQYAAEHDRARDVFVATLGHDLRNPLHAVATTAALLERGGARDPVQAGALIGRSARRMERLISDLLDFARARLGDGIPLDRTETDLRPIVQEVVREVAAAHPGRSVTCDPGQGDLRGEWDADRLEQALSNLVANAVEHGEDPIVVRLLDEGVNVAVEVSNRGSIAEDALATLFTPFRSGEWSKGLGLGLYVAQEIARAHGGAVEAATRGDETTFRLVTPRRPP